MKKITLEEFEQAGYLAPNTSSQWLYQMEIFDRRFSIIPDLIRNNNLGLLDTNSRELLACYLEGKVKQYGNSREIRSMIRTDHKKMVFEIYNEVTKGTRVVNVSKGKRKKAIETILEYFQRMKFFNRDGEPYSYRTIEELLTEAESEAKERQISEKIKGGKHPIE